MDPNWGFEIGCEIEENKWKSQWFGRFINENAKKLERFGTQHQADLLCVFDIFKELEEFREIHAFIVHYEKDWIYWAI